MWCRAPNERRRAARPPDEACARCPLPERERVLARWQQAVAAFETELEAINVEIAELNLKVPSPRFQRSKLDLSRELDGLRGMTE